MFQLEITDPGVLQDHVVLNNNLAGTFIENNALTSLIPALRKSSQENWWTYRVTSFFENNNKISAGLAFNIK